MPKRSILLLAFITLSSLAQAQSAQWDYLAHPVVVTESPAPPYAVMGFCAPSAFDGFGAQGRQPGAARLWTQPTPPTPEKPCASEIDYGRPVAVSAFVHYFYVPDGLDYRQHSPFPSAFNRVLIQTRDENTTWTERVLLKDLKAECPQVLAVPEGPAARFWRIEAQALTPGAGSLMTYEIETWTGGAPRLNAQDPPRPDFQQAFIDRTGQHTPTVVQPLAGTLAPHAGGPGIEAAWQNGETSLSARLAFTVGGESDIALTPDGPNQWQGNLNGGVLRVQAEPAKLGTLLRLSWLADGGAPSRFQAASVRLITPSPSLYYVPAYVWNREPVSVLANICNVQTRLTALEQAGHMLCLIPGTDRGQIGIHEKAAHVNLVLGQKATPILLAALPGDWWTAYRYAVRDIYDFQEQPQTVPVSEFQYGISRYLLSDEVWEPHVGTLKSWPKRDPHTKLYGDGFDCFAFYGVPYSIPTYLSRHIMNGEPLALDRATSIALWLCRSGVRVKEGPIKGAFYTLQRFLNGETPTLEKSGGTQAWQPYATSQATGACLWALHYYRKVSGLKNLEVDRAIVEGAAWLLKSQTAEGGWPYGHSADGKATPDAAPSSGCIWNIWALHRLGLETGKPEYAEAVRRAVAWYGKTFIEPHHYHGYWEDVGPGSREGYEAAIATIVLAELGEKELALAAARDAVQWVFTRQIEPREPDCSASLVAEQTGWPPASYCNPMMGLAGWTAWQLSGQDSFWQPFAMIPKANGWWYQPESGAMVWIVDATVMAPVVGKAFESWWADWCIAQVGTLSQRWLLREIMRRAGDAVKIDEELLKGTIVDQPVTCWAPPGGLQPALPTHGQVNWMGFRGEGRVVVAFFNHGPKGEVNYHLKSRDGLGAVYQPKTVYAFAGGQRSEQPWNGEAVPVEQDGLVLLEWEIWP